MLSILLLAQRRNRDVSHGGFELNQWMRAVVAVGGQGLTFGAEIGIMANRALVSIANDIALGAFRLAQWSVTVNARMTLHARCATWNRIKEWNKPMGGMGLASIFDASRAIIPIGTVHALMPDAINILLKISYQPESRRNLESFDLLCHIRRKWQSDVHAAPEHISWLP